MAFTMIRGLNMRTIGDNAVIIEPTDPAKTKKKILVAHIMGQSNVAQGLDYNDTLRAQHPEYEAMATYQIDPAKPGKVYVWDGVKYVFQAPVTNYGRYAMGTFYKSKGDATDGNPGFSGGMAIHTKFLASGKYDEVYTVLAARGGSGFSVANTPPDPNNLTSLGNTFEPGYTYEAANDPNLPSSNDDQDVTNVFLWHQGEYDSNWVNADRVTVAATHLRSNGDNWIGLVACYNYLSQEILLQPLAPIVVGQMEPAYSNNTAGIYMNSIIAKFADTVPHSKVVTTANFPARSGPGAAVHFGLNQMGTLGERYVQKSQEALLESAPSKPYALANPDVLGNTMVTGYRLLQFTAGTTTFGNLDATNLAYYGACKNVQMTTFSDMSSAWKVRKYNPLTYITSVYGFIKSTYRLRARFYRTADGTTPLEITFEQTYNPMWNRFPDANYQVVGFNPGDSGLALADLDIGPAHVGLAGGTVIWSISKNNGSTRGGTLFLAGSNTVVDTFRNADGTKTFPYAKVTLDGVL